MTAPWKETTLPTILSRYKLDDIYNADEFGLLFRMQPNKSLNRRSEACTRGKHSKTCLTGMAAAIAMGDKIPMFVIGKSKPLAVSKELNTYLADTGIKIKAGWIAYCLKSGYGKWIRNLQKRRKK